MSKLTEEQKKSYAAKARDKYRGSAEVRERRRIVGKKYRDTGAEKILKRTRLLRSWNEEITYPEIYSLFDGKCAICSIEIPLTGKQTHLDHSHKENRFRGLLCHHCNLLIGNAKENIETLRLAMIYLGG